MSSIPSLIPSAIGEIVRQTELCPAGKYKVSGNKLKSIPFVAAPVKNKGTVSAEAVSALVKQIVASAQPSMTVESPVAEIISTKKLPFELKLLASKNTPVSNI